MLDARRFLRAVSISAFALVAIGFGVWGALALWYRAPFAPALQISVAAIWVAVMLGVLVGFFIGPRRLALAILAAAIAMLLAWWSTLLPASDRDWAPDVAHTVQGAMAGDTLTLTNVRNFEWRTESEFTARWETRRYDLSKLVSIDLIADYWAGEAIAHTMVSFGFSDGQFLVWSIEMRRLKTQSYSAVAGFFKHAELVILAGDERDMIRLRTNVRPEDLRLYRLRSSPEVARRALLTYVDEANELAKEPRWYNTATTNCTTVVFNIAKVVEPDIPHDPRVVLSGYFPDYAYDHKALDQSLPFAELRERAKISTRAKAADTAQSAAFSQAIRAGIPGIPDIR